MDNFDLKLHFKCNNNCIHCVVADKRSSGSLSVPKICRIIDMVPPSSSLQLTGGEPTLFRELPFVLRYAKEHGLFTIVQTNGTGFSDSAFFRKCLPYLDHVHMAIHSSDPDVHDEIVGSPGMWKKTMEGFKNVFQSNIVLTTQTVLSKVNIATLHDTFCFIQGIREGTRMSMTYPHLMGNAWHNRNRVAFRYSDFKEEIQKTLRDFHKHIFTEAIPPCYLHPYADKVISTSESEILKGNNSRLGIDFSQNLETRNYNKSDTETHRKAPRCKECIYDKTCIGVWKEYIELFRDRLDLYPVKESQSESKDS